ncbi:MULTISPECIES: carbamoyltransferase family protein [Streptomyces]|uniref:Carbamoyl transferase n=1 Tax=Streptomyces luteocolor TaxID=285500 RepID=A0A125SZD0_9ACTN|nr:MULTISPECIES: carbamoyltransferase C-terminal domain-containing protein [Streptomyces]BAU50934.1 carbamoyl transferase [Streptomyces luteocolor]
MRILGVNGWPGASHDASACLLVDGEVVAFAEEERFTRDKHAYGQAPHHAVAHCLAEAGLGIEDIDIVAHGWEMPALLEQRGLEWFPSDAEALDFLLPRSLFPRGKDPRLLFVEHHMAHAASAYYFSGHDSGAVLILDGQGETESATLAVGSGGDLKVLRTVSPGWSLGYFYAAVCEYAGLGADAAGKLMGLAPYGTVGDTTFGGALLVEGDGYRVDAVPEDLLSRGRTDEEDDTIRLWLARLEKTLDVPPNAVTRGWDPALGRYTRRTARDPFAYRDLAATAQAALEHSVLAMVRGLLRDTGESTLLVAGGVGFNATLNGKLMRLPQVEDLFVQPLAGDQGVSLGAAGWVAAQAGERISPMTGTVAWGPQWGPDAIRHVLGATGTRYTEPDDIAAETARLLARGEIVGWHQGRSEGGPRALGQRSILAAPSPAEQQHRINLTIKDREAWRPFAPSLQEEAAAELLDLHTGLPYMIVTVPVPERSRARLAAATHVDGTTRPQTVSADVNPLYHRLLGEVETHTGSAVVLNTSFNGNAEPVVCSPRDALATFARSPLDALALGPFLVHR